MGLLLFFLGFSLQFQRDTGLNILTLFVVVIFTIAVSYWNRSPIGGLVLGIFTSISFVLGLFVTVCTWELSVAVASKRDFTLSFLGNVLSTYGRDYCQPL